ncbi:hypothetical protein Ancab_006063 [Ancistrocladus abbreviatus]
MAATSPAPSNSSNEIAATPATPTTFTITTSTTAPPAAASTGKTTALPTITLQRADPPKTLRGLNKPKCIKCGNVARSRCPYQSCKSCCSKAQNPCHIHVLKPNATLADRSSSNSTIPEQQSNEVPSSGPSHKVASLRQLSSNFAQFNNVHVPIRSRKPLSRKDAVTINEWRFSKLKEYKESNIAVENEAFDRYMQNISLLEEVFDVCSEVSPEDDTLNAPPTTSGEKTRIVSGMKVKIRSNPVRINEFRKRIQHIVDQGLRKLQKCDLKDGGSELTAEVECDQTPKRAKKGWTVETSALYELNDKLNKVRNEEDLKSCLQMMPWITSQQREIVSNQASKELITKNDSVSEQGTDYSLLKLVRTHEIGHDALKAMDVHFASLEEIEDL